MRRDIEDLISKILRWGVTISAAVIALGVLSWLTTGKTGNGPLIFPPGSLIPQLQKGPLGPYEVAQGLWPPRPYYFIALGLALLILTPIVRVATSLALFLRDRDRAYIAVTALVLLVLALSFSLGAVAP